MGLAFADDLLITATVDGSAPWKDGHFEVAGVRFTGVRDLPLGVRRGGLDISGAPVNDQDNQNPVGNGVMFGRDTLGGPVWGFDFHTRAADGNGALAIVEALAKAWRTGQTLGPGKVTTLRYQTAGRRRRVYGRPRRFAGPTPDLLTAKGKSYVTADFQCADDLHYEDTLRSQTITLLTDTSGGFILPSAWPVETVAGGQRQGMIDDVGGNAPTPFEVVIRGPIRSPWAAGPGWRLELPGVVLGVGQSVTASTYPWALTVLRNDGYNLSGGLSWKSRLSGARMNPGPGEFTFGGIDPTNTATCTVQWRPAYYSL